MSNVNKTLRAFRLTMSNGMENRGLTFARTEKPLAIVITFLYTFVYTLKRRICVDVATLHKYIKGKTRIITFKINPQLLSLLDMSLKEDKDIHSRSEFFERCVLRYLAERGKLK